MSELMVKPNKEQMSILSKYLVLHTPIINIEWLNWAGDYLGQKVLSSRYSFDLVSIVTDMEMLQKACIKYLGENIE